MVEPEVFDWDEWENGKVYTLSNDELVGALLSEVSALRKRVKLLEDRQPGLIQPVHAARFMAAVVPARSIEGVCQVQSAQAQVMGGLSARRVGGRSGGIGGRGCRRGPDHKAGGASITCAMAYAAAS